MFASHRSRSRKTVRSTSASCNGLKGERESAAWVQDPRDLGHGFVAREPVKGLGGEDGVDRLGLERDRLGAAGERLRAGNDLLEHLPHRTVRLDRNHPREPRGERSSQLPGSCPEVDHCRVRPQVELAHDSIDQLLRPLGPAELVLASGIPERVGRRFLSQRLPREMTSAL